MDFGDFKIGYKIGNVVDILNKIPNEKFNMSITSPPYWGLRDYGVDANTIWDGDKDCKHQWSDYTRKEMSGGTESKKVQTKGTDNFQKFDDTEQSYCQKCGAWKGQLGLEPSFELYISHLCDIFDGVKRVLRDDGVIFVNLGDTYSGSGELSKDRHGCKESIGAPKQPKINIPAKSLIMIPYRFAIEMVNRGWILRNTIIWHKPNCMPSSAKDRFTVDFEYMFFFSKNKKYYFEQQLEEQSRIKSRPDWNRPRKVKKSNAKTEGMKGTGADLMRRWLENPEKFNCGRNKRAVWSICPQPYPEAHFAVYPPELIKTPIKAGCPIGGIILDPFVGSGTTLLVARDLKRSAFGIEINPDYKKMIDKRLNVKQQILVGWV